MDELTQRVLALSTLISANTHSLPKYDVKRALTESSDTRTLVEQTRGKLVPRKKFTFKSRGKRNNNGGATGGVGEDGSGAKPPLTSATSGWVAAVAAAAGANAAAGQSVLGGLSAGDDQGGGGAVEGQPVAATSSSSSSGSGGAGALQEATHMLSGRTGETLVVAPGQLSGSGGSDYFLKDLTDCVVKKKKKKKRAVAGR